MFPMRVSDWKRHKKCFSVHADTAATYLPTYTYELLTLISNVCARGLHTCLSLPLSHTLFLLKIGMLVFKHWQAANYGLIRTSFLLNPPRFGGTAKNPPKRSHSCPICSWPRSRRCRRWCCHCRCRCRCTLTSTHFNRIKWIIFCDASVCRRVSTYLHLADVWCMLHDIDCNVIPVFQMSHSQSVLLYFCHFNR